MGPSTRSHRSPRQLLAALLLAALPVAQAPHMVLADGYAAPDVAGMVAGVAADPAAAVDANVVASPLESALFDLVNSDRVASGLPRLEFDPSLLPVARERAAAQKPLPSLNHYDPDGKLAFVKLLAAGGVDYQLAGENLARLTGPDSSTAVRAEDALMHSPTHRANILEGTFNRMAIGASLDDNGRVIYAQIFRNKAW